MAEDPISLDTRDHLARITINRPERLNAFDPDTHVAFSAALDRFEQDDDLWVAVLTGAGTRSFCAGRDLKQLAESNARGAEGPAADAAKMRQVRRLTDRFDMTKPIIARLNGHALGVAWNWRWPATSSLPPTMRNSAYPSLDEASSPAPWGCIASPARSPSRWPWGTC
jgi:enoyl-CoA hydratase/carnithine racemase